MNEHDLARVAEAIAEGGAAAFTGAGASVESGIPDFRGGGGIWARFDPMEYATLTAFKASPAKVWRFFAALDELVRGKRPNAGHFALGRLDQQGLLRGIATQNIDGFHQASGVPAKRVIELHGNATRLGCIRCGYAEARPDLASVDPAKPPRCPGCGHALKPDVILFGEALPPGAMESARRLVQAVPVLLVVGTTATVYPAAELPQIARDEGHLVVEINKEATILTGGTAHISLLGPAGAVLPALTRAVEAIVAK